MSDYGAVDSSKLSDYGRKHSSSSSEVQESKIETSSGSNAKNETYYWNECSRLLITGGAGFIASHLVDYIFQKYPNITIVVVDSLTYCSDTNNLNSKAIFECADICDEKAMMNILIKHRIDGILHLAAESHVGGSYQNPYLFLETNVKGTLVLLECMKKINHSTVHLMTETLETVNESKEATTNDKETKRSATIIGGGSTITVGVGRKYYTGNTVSGCDKVYNAANCDINTITQIDQRNGPFVMSTETKNKLQRIKKFLHCSTDEVYGSAIHSKHEEKATLLNPTNPYSASKAAAEMFCISYIHSYKLPIVITRANNIYGVNQYYEKVIPRFVKRLSEGLLPEIQGSGSQKRTFLHSSDAADGLFTVFRNGKVGEIYNIGAKDEITIRELAEKIVSIINEYDNKNYKTEFPNIEDRPFNDLSYEMTTEKIEKELSWFPKVEFEHGLKQVVVHLYNKYKGMNEYLQMH